ncbi:MAG: hypothetical protein PHR35_07975 [Kiritimatiellae bacterium]|nr:hypothetical protein [Kiritimatiellia bacterium]
MRSYRVREEELVTMRKKLVAAQTLLNVNSVALTTGRRPVSAAARLDLAEEAEELVHDVAEILDGVHLRG